MAVVIINSRQVSPVDFFLGLVDKFDHPTGRTIAQGLDFDNFLICRNVTQKSEVKNSSALHVYR